MTLEEAQAALDADKVEHGEGWHTRPVQRWDMATRAWRQVGFQAYRAYREGQTYGIPWAGTKPTREEALAAGRKAEARHAAQVEEDRVIEQDYGHTARVLAASRWISKEPVSGPPPETLRPGMAVRLWAHGRQRVGVVGAVSKTGARARVIYCTPSAPDAHLTTYARTDLGVLDGHLS